jgi:murein DD-endopeptidase MepM/ murein hydrolase activator NlpD
MQFLTTTWRGVARLGPGRPPGASPSIDNIFDAAATAAAYLCGASGSLGDVRAAVLNYNHSDRYVDQVLAKAAEYGMGQTTQPAILLAGMACPVGGPMSHSRDWQASRSGGREHQGNDLMGALGTPLVAIESGIIDKASDTDVGLGGITIWVRGDSGTRYYYAHNLRNVARVGQRVIAGEVIAYLGKTGNARTTAPHVHFEVHPGGGSASDPYELIARICSKA